MTAPSHHRSVRRLNRCRDCRSRSHLGITAHRNRMQPVRRLSETLHRVRARRQDRPRHRTILPRVHTLAADPHTSHQDHEEGQTIMSVDVSKIKPGDDVRLEGRSGNTLTGVVNEFAGELGIWFGGSWFPLSSWSERITLIARAEPEQPEWADAWVVRDAQGFFWLRSNDVHWETHRPEFAYNPQTASELSDLGPITVVIDRDGQNVEARDVRDAADSCIQDLEDHLRCTEKSRDFAIVTGNTRLQAIRHILDGDDE